MKDQHSAKSKKFSRVLIVLGTIIFCLFILEIGLRLVNRAPSGNTVDINEQWGDSYKLQKNVIKKFQYPAFTFTVYTNSYGFRDKNIGPRPIKNNQFYVFLGASDVFGNGVEYEESFIGLVDEHASKKGIDVLNMAIGGHYFVDQVELFKEFMNTTGYKPSKLFFCLNGLHIPKYDERRKNVFVKNGITLNKDQWQLRYFRLMVGNLSASYVFFRDSFRKLQAKWLDFELKQDTPEFLNIYSKNNRIRQPEILDQFKKYLNTFEQYCYQNDIEIIYIYLPIADSFNMVDLLKLLKENPDNYDTSFYERLMTDYCNTKNIELINLRPLLKKYHEEGKKLRFQLDPHYNHFTNREVGEYLIKAIFHEN